MPTTPEYRHGRIIWAYVRPSTKDRRRQQHPAVIISPETEIIQPERFDPRKDPTSENMVTVVGVSTKFRNYPEQRHVELPYRQGGHPETGLKAECAAIIGWYDVIAIPDDVSDMAGQVPSRIMRQIDEMVRQDIAKRLGKDFSLLGQAVLKLLLGNGD